MSDERERWERCATALGGVLTEDRWAFSVGLECDGIVWDAVRSVMCRDRILALADRALRAEAALGLPEPITTLREYQAMRKRAERAEALIRDYVAAATVHVSGSSMSYNSAELFRLYDKANALLSDLDAREKAGREA